MADPYTYCDNKPVIVTEGEHGMNVRLPQSDTNYLQCLPDDGQNHATFELRNYCAGDAKPLVCRQHRDSDDRVTLDRMAVVEFISFGHSHIYPPEQYPEVAPLWRDRLLAEARVLARALQGDQAIAYEFLEGDGSLGAWMSLRIAHAIDAVKRRNPVKASDYDPLMKGVWDIADKVKAGTAADYQLLHDSGLEFMHIRHEQDLLRKKLLERMGELRNAAEKGQTAAEETEKASFWILDLYGQVVCKDAASLFAYRFGVLLVRAGARGAGSLLADNSAQATFQQVAGVMRQDLPKAATALMLSFVKRGFPKMGAVETFAEQLIAIQIHVFFICLEFEIFELDRLPPNKRAHADQALLEKLASELAQDIVNAIAAIVVAGKVRDLPADSPVRKQVESIGAVVPAVINSCLGELTRMKQIAEAENRPFSDIFTSEGGWALVRIIRDGGKAFLDSVIKGRMQAAHENDVAYYRALILSLKLHLTPVDAARMQGSSDRPPYVQAVDQKTGQQQQETSWDKKLKKGKTGPDENGDIGLGKLNSVAGKATSKDKSNPTKPTRSQRNKVKRTPESNKIPTPEEMVARIGPAHSWQEIEQMTAAGKIRDKAHVLAVIVRNPANKTIKEWYEVSELDVAVGAAKLLGHTEQKAMARVSLMKLEPGSRIIFVGHLQPCNLTAGCNAAMKAFVARTRIPIEYRTTYSEDGTTHIDYDPAEGRMSDRDRKTWKKNN
jgi:hypothetical protein